jgi:hypothetical protein
MLCSIRRGWYRGIPAIALLAASFAQAQGTASRTERADPLDPQARVPVVIYQSPLAKYRRLGDDTSVSWKAANETVNRIGGWRAYAREAQQPDPAASAAGGRGTPAPEATPSPGSAPARGGHKTH